MVFGIQKVFSLVKLLKKKNKKILVSLYTTVNYLNQTLQKKKNFFFCFIAKNFLCIVLKILQKIGVILAWFLVPFKLRQFLMVGKKSLFFEVALVYLSAFWVRTSGGKSLYLFSRPSRHIFLTFAALRVFVGSNNNFQKYFILNTVKGLLPHTEALKNRIGGHLLCVA